MGRKQEERVEEFLGLFSAQDVDYARLHDCLAPDVAYQGLTPVTQVIKGREAVLNDLRRQFSSFNECDCRILTIVSNDRHVFTERLDQLTMLHDGTRTRIGVNAVFELDGQNQIVAWREYWDALEIAVQLKISGEQMREMLHAKEPA